MINESLGIGHRRFCTGPFSIDQAGSQFNQLESLSKITYCFLGIKILAGENVYINVVPLNERVDADMAFGDEDESRYSPVV
jgi:hypothetical protein